MKPQFGLRALLFAVLLAASFAILFRAAWAAKVTRPHVLDSHVESAGASTVVLVIDLDMDLSAPEWEKHVRRFEYLVLDEERLVQLRTVRPELPAGVQGAGDELMRHYEDHFVVFANWKVQETTSWEAMLQGGGVERGTQIGDRRRRYRIAVPLSNRDATYKGRPGEYLMSPGREYQLWGQMIGRTMGPFSFESSVFKLRVRVPEH